MYTHRTFGTGLFQGVVDRDIAGIEAGPLEGFSKNIYWRGDPVDFMQMEHFWPGLGEMRKLSLGHSKYNQHWENWYLES